MIAGPDLTALILTLKLAAVSTLVLLVLGTPLAWWLARTRFRFRFLIEAVIALPLVLPPTVLGFYLLIALGPKSAKACRNAFHFPARPVCWDLVSCHYLSLLAMAKL